MSKATDIAQTIVIGETIVMKAIEVEIITNTTKLKEIAIITNKTIERNTLLTPAATPTTDNSTDLETMRVIRDRAPSARCKAGSTKTTLCKIRLF